MMCTQRAGEREGDDWPGLEVHSAGAPLSAKAARAAKPIGDLDLLAAFALEDGDDATPQCTAGGSDEGRREGSAPPDAAPTNDPAAEQKAAEAPSNGPAEGLAGREASPVAAVVAAQAGTAMQQLPGDQAPAKAPVGAGGAAAGPRTGPEADGEPAAKRQRIGEQAVAGASGEAGAGPGTRSADSAGKGAGGGDAACGPARERSGSAAGPSDSFHSALSEGAAPPLDGQHAACQPAACGCPVAHVCAALPLTGAYGCMA